MCALRKCWFVFLIALAVAPLPAQVGNPGGYPGQYPPTPGGTGIPIPRRRKKSDQKVQLQSTSGMLRRIEKEQVIMEADDHRILNYKRTSATKFLKAGNPLKPDDLKPGDFIEIESSEDDEGFMTAVNVMWQQDGDAKSREHAAEPVEVSMAKTASERAKAGEASDEKPAPEPAKAAAAPTPKPEQRSPEEPNPADLNAPATDHVKAVQIDADDQGPPVLKRGGSVVHRQAAPPPEPAPASAPAVESTARNEQPEEEEKAAPVKGPQRAEEVVIEKARDAAGNFLESLPNYYCQEVMTRYQSGSSNSNWQPLDVLSMALVYEKGQESYRNLQVNGRSSKKKMEDLGGAWSTGEFGTVLADLFSPLTAADFEFRKESRTAGRSAMVYDFTVDREHSHWRIMVASQLITPSYQGSVWIDKATSRVLRIEMQATHIPDAFPTDKVEMATDYEFVRFGDREFLVPTHAETLGCQRDSGTCSRNAIDFRNYHKYAGEATITFDR